MTITTILSKKKCKIWHNWSLIFGNSITNYYICEKCGSRKAEQIEGIYQPIDWSFLKKANPDING